MAIHLFWKFFFQVTEGLVRDERWEGGPNHWPLNIEALCILITHGWTHTDCVCPSMCAHVCISGIPWRVLVDESPKFWPLLWVQMGGKCCDFRPKGTNSSFFPLLFLLLFLQGNLLLIFFWLSCLLLNISLCLIPFWFLFSSSLLAPYSFHFYGFTPRQLVKCVHLFRVDFGHWVSTPQSLGQWAFGVRGSEAEVSPGLALTWGFKDRAQPVFQSLSWVLKSLRSPSVPAHPSLTHSAAVTGTAIHSPIQQVSIEHLPGLRSEASVQDSLVNRAAMAPVLQQSTPLFVVKPYRELWLCFFMTGFICWISGCHRVSASEQDLSWGRDMAGLMMGSRLRGLHPKDGGLGNQEGASSARPLAGCK